jgi:D-alanyl-D-alanine carboxypeptidase
LLVAGLVSAHPFGKAISPGSGWGEHSQPALAFGGSTDLPNTTVETLFAGFGMVKADLGNASTVSGAVGFAIYDRNAGRIVASHNLDRSFNLASTTKLFTMDAVGAAFRGDPILRAHRSELSRILRTSDNRRASLWMLLARQRISGRGVDYVRDNALVTGNCYGGPLRSARQREAELEAATAFFEVHRRAYAIDWTGSQLVDGAGCERGLWPGHEDRMTPRQYLTVLDSLRQRDFGGWNAFELMPQMRSDGAVLADNVILADALRQNLIVWKTGTDALGIKNIAGYISNGGDPFAYYFVMFINTGRSPPHDVGLTNGGAVVSNFAAWAARFARQSSPAP